MACRSALALAFASLLVGATALKGVMQRKDRDVIFVTGSTSGLSAMRSAEIVENWKRAEGVYSCEQAATRLRRIQADDGKVKELTVFQKLAGQKQPVPHPRLVLHIQAWCPELIKKFPKFIHVADPLQGKEEKRKNREARQNNETVDSNALPEGMCGMLIAADLDTTRKAAASRYGNGADLRTWYVPSASLSHYKACARAPLSQAQPSHKILLRGMPQLQASATGAEAELHKEQTEKLQIITQWAVDMQNSGIELEVVAEEARMAEGVSLMRKASEAKASSKAECDQLKNSTIVLLWDSCVAKDGKRTGKHDRRACYDFSPADNMLTAQHLGIPVFGYGEVEAWKDVATSPDNVQKEAKPVLKEIEKLLRDHKEYFIAHQRAVEKSKQFEIEHVVNSHYEAMVADAFEKCKSSA